VEGYLVYNGTEIANANRIFTYLNNGLGPVGTSPPGSGALCTALALASYVSPSADPAPWYDAAKGESAAFLGFLPWQVNLIPSMARATQASGQQGSAMGRLSLAGQLLQVQGWLVATSPASQEYGERWLLSALRTVTTESCDTSTVTILPACPGAGEAATFRNLYRTGLVDYTPAQPLDPVTPASHFRQVAFQMRSELPWMFVAPVTVLNTTTTFPATIAGVATTKSVSTGIRFTIVAGTGVAAGPWTITGTVTAGAGPAYSVTVGAIAAGTTLTIDGGQRDVQLRNASGVLIGGIDALNLIAPFTWPEMLPSSTMTWTVALAGGGVKNANSSAKIERLDREV
jgi:hypothetical protein